MEENENECPIKGHHWIDSSCSICCSIVNDEREHFHAFGMYKQQYRDYSFTPIEQGHNEKEMQIYKLQEYYNSSCHRIDKGALWEKPDRQVYKPIVYFQRDCTEEVLSSHVLALRGTVTSIIGECTHFVLHGRLRRTTHTLIAICIGAHVVDSEWIVQSISANKFLDERTFIVSTLEEYLGEELSVVLQRARRRRLYPRWTFCFRELPPRFVDEIQIILPYTGAKGIIVMSDDDVIREVEKGRRKVVIIEKIDSSTPHASIHNGVYATVSPHALVLSLISQKAIQTTPK